MSIKAYIKCDEEGCEEFLIMEATGQAPELYAAGWAMTSEQSLIDMPVMVGSFESGEYKEEIRTSNRKIAVPIFYHWCNTHKWFHMEAN